MKHAENPRIALYKEAIALEEKRAVLQAELDALLARLSEIKNGLFDSDGVISTDASAVAKSPKRVAGRAGRGELKSKILNALSAAGSAGIRVKDLASTLGAKVANIHSWFQSSMKRIPQLKKVGAARYRLEGALGGKELGKGNGKMAKSLKLTTVTKGGRRHKSTRPLSKRGELAKRIMAALQSAGSEGLKVHTLADKLGVKQKNLYIWFSTTGKKNKAIKKVGEAHYRLEPSGN